MTDYEIKTIQAVSKAFRVAPDQILGLTRHQMIVLARWTAMWIFRYRYKMTYGQIAEVFRRDVGTAAYGCKQIDGIRMLNADFSESLDKLADSLPPCSPLAAHLHR